MSSRLRGVGVAGKLVLSWAALSAALQTAIAQGDTPDAPTRRVVVRFSGQLLAPLFEKPIDELAAVDDVILGTHVTGTARVAAQPSLELPDDSKRAAFTVRLSGVAHSKTVGRNGPAILHCRGETRFHATKRVTFDPQRGFVTEPADVTATTKNTTERVESTIKGLVEPFIIDRAWSQVTANRPQIDAVIREKTEHRVASEFDRLLESRLARFNQLLQGRPALAAVLGEGACDYSCSTREGCLQIVAAARHVDLRGAGAPDLPALSHSPAAVQIWIEDSVLGDLPALTLRRLDVLRDRLGLAATAYRLMPTAHVPVGRDLARLGPVGRIEFATSGDWLVVQLGTQPAEGEHLAARP